MTELSLQQKLLKKRMEVRDSITPSPDSRATRIYNILKEEHPEFSAWDLICFCIEYLASQAVIHNWLRTPVAHIAQLVYTAHYDLDQLHESAFDSSSTGDNNEHTRGQATNGSANIDELPTSTDSNKANSPTTEVHDDIQPEKRSDDV